MIRVILIAVLVATTPLGFAQKPASEPLKKGELRIATFNAYLNRSREGEILENAQSGNDQQIAKVAEIIQRVRPEILLLQEFDYVADAKAVKALIKNYLNVPQGKQKAIDYPYLFLAESNTGLITQFDLNNDGSAAKGGGDAYGFGEFHGQYAMVLLSQYPFIENQARTFQKFLWRDMPNNMLPLDWYSEEERAVFRLSSKSHWDIPVEINGRTVHILASHPTPPVFDGDEDRNGRRNHDEIRFLADYVDAAKSNYIYDDKGRKGGLAPDSRFVILGDLNASAVEGDATNNPIGMFERSSLINTSIVPTSEGGAENAPNNPHGATHTASWKIRVDYVLPSTFGIRVEQAGVYWPATSSEAHHLVGPGVQSSDHRLVFIDASLINQ